MDKISVIVPVYNVRKYLKKAIYSIINQKYRNLEIILVDDGSTDGSGEICDEFKKIDDRIVVYHKENGGLSSTRNYGMKKATGDYVIFIDSDDYIHQEMIFSLYEERKKVDADVSVCGIMNVYNTKEIPQCNDTEQNFVYNQKEFLKELLIGEKIPGSICNKLLKREIAEKLSFTEGKIYEDVFYHLELIKLAKTYVITTKPYYYYYHRSDSITTEKYNSKKLDVLEAYMKYAEYIEKEYPDLKQEAFFRLAHSYFVVLDSMLLIDNYKKLDDYPSVINFLKKNAFRIFKNSIFRKGRRIAALALKINVSFYRKLMLEDLKRNKGIN